MKKRLNKKAQVTDRGIFINLFAGFYFVFMLILIAACLSGCAAPSKLTFTPDGVIVKSKGQELIKYSDGTRTAEYDSRQPSLLRTITEAAALREVNKN